MITRFWAKNFKALRDVSLDLTPVHVLIGPNDSGKTSILEAIAGLCRSVDHPFQDAFVGAWQGKDLVWRGNTRQPLTLGASFHARQGTMSYELSIRFAPEERKATLCSESYTNANAPLPLFDPTPAWAGSGVHQINYANAGGPEASLRAAREIHDALKSVQYYRWNTRFLSLPVAPSAKSRFRMESSGFGLALCLDDILGFDRQRFNELEARFRIIFPDIKSIKLLREAAYTAPQDNTRAVPILHPSEGKGIYFEFANDAHLVPASQVSDGVLLVLAYLTILYVPEPPRVLLVEEPENGIHPGRLKNIIQILRDLIQEQIRTQIVMTTHSPYILDFFQPEEVSVCIKGDDGAIAVRKLSDSKSVRDQIDIFSLGEIWTASGDKALAGMGDGSNGQ